MKYVMKTDLYNYKDIVVKLGDIALNYINNGYKVYIPDELIIDGETGIVIKNEQDL
jgi:hypothetical protein